MSLSLRPATVADVALVLAFIRDLAEYERLAHEVVATEPLLRETLFGARPGAEVVIAELDGEPVGSVQVLCTNTAPGASGTDSARVTVNTASGEPIG